MPILPALPPLMPPSRWELRVDQAISGPGTIGYLALGTVIPFLERDRQPTQQALRGIDAVAASVAVAERLKRLTQISRPDTGTPDSFPSGHATAAFAMATVRAQLRPGQAWEWFAGATAISVSRVRLERHRWLDVLAGAALGFGMARLELSQPRGLGLNPVITRPTRELETLSQQPGWRPLVEPGIWRLGVSYGVRF
jgi:membrane-associated phospholipid phosphatase